MLDMNMFLLPMSLRIINSNSIVTAVFIPEHIIADDDGSPLIIDPHIQLIFAMGNNLDISGDEAILLWNALCRDA